MNIRVKMIVSMLLGLVFVSGIFCLAACGGTSEADVTEAADDTSAAVPETSKLPVPETEPPEEVPVTLDSMKEKLIGTWTVSGLDLEQLTFNADGTGTYKGIMDKDCTFTYSVTEENKTYNNGAEYTDYMLKIDYSTGESEEIIFDFKDGNGGTYALTFHGADSGGYSGVINFDVWINA